MAILDSLPEVTSVSAENPSGDAERPKLLGFGATPSAQETSAAIDASRNEGLLQMEVVRIFLPGELDSEDLAVAIRRLLALDDAA